MEPEKKRDVLIIGGSYSGLAAAMALGRALRTVLIIDSGDPCNKQTPFSHNFLTRDGEPPAEISRLAWEQVSLYPTVSRISGKAIAVQKTAEGFETSLESGKRIISRKLLFATGVKDIMPGLPGFSESWGISVLHCPYCHGYEVRLLPTGILASGDAGFDFAAMISNWTDDLTLFTNGPSGLSETQLSKLALQQIAIEEKKIRYLDHEKGQIRQVVFEDGSTKTLRALYAKPAFKQHSDLPLSLGCELNEEGYIKVNAEQQTTVPGVYASGDNTSRMRTVANAVAQGTLAGMMMNKEMIVERFQV